MARRTLLVLWFRQLLQGGICRCYPTGIDWGIAMTLGQFALTPVAITEGDIHHLSGFPLVFHPN